MVRVDPNADTTYDSNGNPTGNTADDTTYTYDEDNNRVSEGQVGFNPKQYVLDKNNPSGYPQILEVWVSALQTSYLLGRSVLAQDVRGGQVTYLMPDGHGSTRQLTSYTGGSPSVLARYDYDAFGNTITFTASTHPANTASTIVLYAGEPLDSTTGNYVMGVRQYDPALDRFVEMDPRIAGAGDIQNANWYVYTHGDPLNFVDRTGMFLGGLTELNTTTSLLIAWGALTVGLVTVLGGGLFAMHAALQMHSHLTTWNLQAISSTLHAPLEMQYNEDDQDRNNYRYFVHGTTMADWGTSAVVDPTSGYPNADFGLGFYTFESTSWGFRSASRWAIKKAGPSGIPFVIEFRIPITEYNALTKLDFNDPLDQPFYQEFVNENRRSTEGGMLSASDYDVIIGPIATKDANGVYKADYGYPDQYRFSVGASPLLTPVAIIPAYTSLP